MKHIFLYFTDHILFCLFLFMSSTFPYLPFSSACFCIYSTLSFAFSLFFSIIYFLSCFLPSFSSDFLCLSSAFFFCFCLFLCLSSTLLLGFLLFFSLPVFYYICLTLLFLFLHVCFLLLLLSSCPSFL